MNIWDNEVYKEDLDTAINSVEDFGELKERKIMITGASGLIGSFLVDMLIRANEVLDYNIVIYAVGRNVERLIKRFGNHENVIYVQQDLGNDVKFDFEVDYVIHAASNAYPEVFDKDPVGTMMTNLIGTKNLLDYSQKCSVKRFMFVSSGEVYGNQMIDKEALSERDYGFIELTNPRSCYPSSKRAAETLCVSYTKQYGLDTVIVRPCHTYGPNVTELDNRANAEFVRSVLHEQNIVLKSKGEQLRSYCYVADCVSGMLTVLLKGKTSEAYNIVNNNEKVTIFQFAEIVAELAGKKVVFEQNDTLTEGQKSPIRKQVLCGEKLEDLGWKGKFSIQNGIKHTLLIQAEANGEK